MLKIKINNICEKCNKSDVCAKKINTEELIKYCEDRLNHLENGHLSIKLTCIHNQSTPIFEGTVFRDIK